MLPLCSDRLPPAPNPGSGVCRVPRRTIVRALSLLVLIATCVPPAGAAEPAPVLRFREKQKIRTDQLGIRRPGAIAYAGDADLFMVFPAHGPAGEGVAAVRGEGMTQLHYGTGSVGLPVELNSTRTVAYDRRGQRLLVLDVAARSIHAIPGSATGEFATDRVMRLEAPRAAALRPVGMTVDPVSGEVFVLDRLMRRIVRFTPAAADATPEAAAIIPAHRWIELGELATRDLTGLALDPRSGHLFTLDPVSRTVYELTTEGAPVASYDVSAIGFSDPWNLAFGPSGDQTDDPATLSLYVADPGALGTRRGNVIELAWTEPEVMMSVQFEAPATIAASLVRVTKTSLYSPPSPDPSGIAYDSVTGRLVISDAEVEEMGIWANKNVWETSLVGSALRSYNVTSYNIEPCGITFNPNNRFVYISNDDGDIVWMVNPGPDNLMGTNDDTRTSFRTNGFGSGDPEGLAYDRAGNRIFIADGVNEEIYVIHPGNNGVFNGGSDDVITHFDTHSHSVDPETVEWKQDSGTLLVLGSTGSKIVREVTTTGTLRASIDISFAPLSKPAGLAYAPSSGGGGWSYYIVTRGVDNNSDPRENDGTLVEISVGGTVPPPTNTAPTVSAGPDRTITLPAQASLDGTVTDDGLPSPPSLTVTWSKVSGPGTVTFANANAVDTQASFSLAGTYVLRLTASDGALSNSDQMQVIAQPSGGGNVAPTVSAGPDRTITLPAQASLDGTVTDDGLPSPPSLTVTWSKVSGPGTVTFANANAVDTQASFSLAGTYVLQLTASDGALSNSDLMQVIAQSSGGGNVAPTVNAGPDQSVTQAVVASLDGTVSDDGLPTPPALTVTWSMSSGPGTVTFLNPRAVDTQAAFSAAGTYVLQLQASDGALSSTDLIQLTVAPAGGGSGGSVEVRIPTGNDDVEQAATGSVYTNSTDLELVFDGGNQTVGLRFPNITIAKGTPIANAYVQFTADEAQSEVTTLLIQGEASDNAPAFTSTNGTVGSRPRTTASASWSPAPWNSTNEAGANQRTTSLTGIVQELVNRPGWASGNAIALLVTGTGHRTARAFESNAAQAALLHVDLAGGGSSNTAPTVNGGPDLSVQIPQLATLNATVTDDGVPSPSLTSAWSVVSGPGPVSFTDAGAVDTQAGFSVGGTYVLRLAVSDGQLISEDLVQVTVQPPSGGNSAPTVSAGPDLTITLPAQATLDGTVVDDGLPSPPTLTTTWSKVSGPGTVTFANANAVDTQASFSLAGTYVLQLSASDGQLSSSDQKQIVVQPGNTAPTVSAGPDLSVTLPAQASLNGTVTDDGLPAPPTLTTTWSKVSGPGTVTFANANAVDTQASFSLPGTYVVRLTASDGVLSANDVATVNVFAAGTVAVRISAGSDDAEESATGSVATSSTDLELVFSGSNQTVGLRFTGLPIPQGASITSATIQFQADEAQSEVTNLLIQGQNAGNTVTFQGSGNISSRPRTSQSVSWAPAAWNAVGEAGANQRTPNLAAIIQAIVNRSDWVSGNSIVIIITGTGHRTAEGFEGNAAVAPLLQIQYQ